jgi:chemotaxis signal transduction protein
VPRIPDDTRCHGAAAWRWSDRIGGRYLKGIATLNERLIVILNLQALLESAEPILAA